VIDRFSWFILLLLLQFILPPIPSIAATEIQVGAETQSSPAIGFDHPETSAPNTTPQSMDSPQGSLSLQEDDESREVAGGYVVPKQQGLAGLAGMSEISVLADINGQLVSGMAENRVFEDEFTSHMDETGLLESINTSRSFNRESRAALARMDQAKAQTGQALGLLLPSVSVRTNYGYEIAEPSVVVDQNTGELLSHSSHFRTDFTLTATQPLFDLPMYLEWRRRKELEKTREESFRVSDGDAYISTVKAYLSLVSTRLQADVMREFEAQLDGLLSYIEKRANAGAASVSDMSRVRARSQATLSSRLEQESAHLAAGSEFVRLTNVVPQKVRLPVPEDLGASALPETFEAAVTTAMQSNPEIATLRSELMAEKIDIQASKGRFLPRLEAEYTDTYTDHAGGSKTSQRDKRTMLVMSWNLFSGGKDVQFNKERTARHKEIQYRLDDQRRRVVQALAANYSALATTHERIDSGYKELEAIALASEAMSKRMLSGNQSLLDLLDVYDRYYQARSRLINLHVLEMSTVAQLIRLTRGTPWPVSQAPSSESDQGQLPIQPM